MKTRQKFQAVNQTKYIPTGIEPKWQKHWSESGLYKVSLDKDSKKYYLLVELPYPSGDLHMGHWFTFSVYDILARFKRMQGFNVFMPIGFDAFGLPAENAAIKRNINPREWTHGNIDNMKKQFVTMGTTADFEHGVITCDPDYYRWNQWIFLRMFEKGLAYRGEALSNWCPKDQTVLANENVEAGKCWRCGTVVIQKEVEQWFLKITDYADRLIWPEAGGLEQSRMANWPKATIEAQNNWIGRSEGALVKFPISPSKTRLVSGGNVQSPNNKPNFVLLHGFGGSPHDDFFPWLKKSLEEKGWEVQAPILPSSNNPTEDEQVNFVLKNIKADQNTIILGHSLGAVVAMKVLEKLKSPIAGLVLAAGFLEPKFKDNERPFANTFKWQFDFEKIRENVSTVKILSAKNDYAVPAEQGKALAKNLQVELLEVKAQADHFTAEQEPIVLKTLISLSMNHEPRSVNSIEVFTTRPDTIFGATYLAVAPEHPIVAELLNIQYPISNIHVNEVREYVKRAQKKSELERKENKEKTGVFTGLTAKNPASGEEIPVWVADYVLWGYGTGAIMGVPGSDLRDYEFAKKFKLPVTKVVGTSKDDQSLITSDKDVLEVGYVVNSGQFSGLASPEPAKQKFTEFLEEKGFGKRKINYHLHDWSISRQRYWGTPIPIIYCDDCGTVPVPEKDLPVKLPEDVDYAPTGKSPLATAEDFVNVKCPNCGRQAKREVETMDTFVDSSWYFLRYCDPKNDKEIFNKKAVGAWLPVEIYVGGAEHTLGHTLYSRFFVKFLKDLGLVDFEEYAKVRVNHGVILGPDGARMSKSRGNVVNPDELVKQYGADAVRIYLAFMGPYDLVAPWDPNGIRGVYHFLERTWKLAENVGEAEVSSEDKIILNRTIKKVGEDVANIKYNTAVASLMELLNHLSKKSHKGKVYKDEFQTFLKLLAPFAPHMTEELWQRVHSRELTVDSKQKSVKSESKTDNWSIHSQPWPEYDEKYIKAEMVTVVVQVNGKVRDRLLVKAEISKEEVEKLALESAKVQNFLGTKKPKKTIFVPGKLVNFVV